MAQETTPARNHARDARITDAARGMVLGAYGGSTADQYRGQDAWNVIEIQTIALAAACVFVGVLERLEDAAKQRRLDNENGNRER